MLDDRRILIVEDEALLAVDLSLTLEDRGATVEGPHLTIDSAMARTAIVDAAILDVDVCGEAVFPVADRLAAEGTPFVFHTGRSDLAELRRRYGRDIPILPKPSDPAELIRMLIGALDPR